MIGQSQCSVVLLPLCSTGRSAVLYSTGQEYSSAQQRSTRAMRLSKRQAAQNVFVHLYGQGTKEDDIE